MGDGPLKGGLEERRAGGQHQDAGEETVVAVRRGHYQVADHVGADGTGQNPFIPVTVRDPPGDYGQPGLENGPPRINDALVDRGHVQPAGFGGLHDVDGHHRANAEVGQTLESLDAVEHPVRVTEGLRLGRRTRGGTGAGGLAHRFASPSELVPRRGQRMESAGSSTTAWPCRRR